MGVVGKVNVPQNAISHANKPFLLTIPHSGERVPAETPWLQNLPETLLMCDVDRYVDKLYDKAIRELGLPFVKTEWHRYAIDLNRLPDDVDADSVEGHANPSGKFPRGLHWLITTKRERLLPKPMSKALHDDLVAKYFEPFHASVRAEMNALKVRGATRIFHIDAHSMPAMGTSEHPDPGETRADAVISDCDGTSCSPFFRDLVVASYEKAGFKVRVNWPYKGGRVTQTYGKPDRGQESIQVELNRGLYMNEASKALLHEKLGAMQDRLKQAVNGVLAGLPDLS
ncbi:MAG: N-formylglutamate amidohydrolase [Bdellovibrionota bacterium]